MNPDKTLDCRGMRCPRPIVEMAKMIKTMETGHVLEILANDPVARKDIPAWCQKTSQEFLALQDQGSHTSYFVRKAV
ncbi:MAG: sulfurtransferase TusA family protein [Chloroflexi bacterium]|nr:sulfurtransferase TusA family protein [Chloroflexota bacterium]